MIDLQSLFAKRLIVSLLMASYRMVFGSDSTTMVKPGCQYECTGVKVPYPFGIGAGCYQFQILCANISGKRVPLQYDPKFTNPLLSINLEDHTVRISTGIAYQCYRVNGQPSSIPGVNSYPLVATGVFKLSATKNMLVGIGCDTISTVSDDFTVGDTVGCITSCSSPDQAKGGWCPGGHGCCATSIFNTMISPIVRAGSVSNYTQVTSKDHNCSIAFITEAIDGRYDFSGDTLRKSAADYGNMMVPVVFDWGLPSLKINCSEAITNSTNDYFCGSNTRCVDFQSFSYRCKCLEGYTGNPYLSDGCKDINECLNSSLNVCNTPANCVNREGGYHCICPIGFVGNGTKAYPCYPIPKSPTASKAIITLGLSIGLGSIIGFILLFGLCKLPMTQKRIRERKHNFKKNGGLLLQQDMSSNEGAIDKTKIFNQSELEKATENFNDNRVLGRGGQGTVYKGMLMDGTIVAVKKSMKIDETQLAQFINEVVILSQINHRNVVKLFGCCLETEVPLLVYEFVPNGTLYQHIHHPNEDFQLTWIVRLQIAIECAGAIAYLHSSCSSPIYHRDIKSSNILLDEKYKAKISDFGTSKTLSIDKTHVTTCVQGTFGYLDPEFFQSSQFTDKSDVYSFGVVLLELLTSKRPIFTNTSNEPRGLATEFVQLVETNPNELGSILDPRVLQHCSEEEIETLTKLIKRCLSLSGRQRPTMKEVTRTLEMIKSRQGGEEDNSTIEDGTRKQDGVMMNEGPFTSSTTSAFTDTSYSLDVHPLLLDSQ